VSLLNRYEKEKDMIAYCGLYCRICDYYTDKIRNSARNLLEIVRRHRELKIFAETTKAYDFDELLRGLEWLAKELGPCIGGCRGGGGWEECPLRKCCIEKGVEFCFECSEYPCDILEKFKGCTDRLNQIRDMGIEEWVKKQLGIA